MRTRETVRSEEIRALFEQGAPVLFANVVVATVVVGTLWNEAPQARLVAWLSAIVVLSVLRTQLQRSYARAEPTDTDIDAWGRRFVLGSTISGLLWGTAGWLFFLPASALSQTLLTFAIGGMLAAAAGTLACHLPAFYGYFGCALLPLTIRSFTVGDRIHLGLGVMLLVYGIGMQRVARNNNRAFVRAFRLGIENTELLQRLSLSQVELQETNRSLEHRVIERTKALEQQGEALQQAQRLEVAGRLAGGLAHDFNSLLTVVINNSLLMKESQPLDEHGQLAAEETLEAARRGAALIRQLLAFSRRRRPEPRVFSLNQLVEEWAVLLERILGEGVVTVVSLADHATHVRADPAQVEQVLVNLVANARADMPNGGRLQLATEVTSVRGDDELSPGEYVQLIVEHFATEASDADAKQVLDPYSPFGGDARQRGRGFAAVWSIAPQWGGRVAVDSGLGGGARFRVFVPASAEPLSPQSVRRQAMHAQQRSATILVVDDEPTLRAVIRRCLVRQGYTVLVAEDGQRALALARSSGVIDLLITDVVMPGITGLELGRLLRLERPELRVLFISGFTFEEAVPAPDLAKGMAYLPKPFETTALTSKVQELLSTSTSQRAPDIDVKARVTDSGH
jgi:two-component system, cell cycle sensor histidine kinase and response regulator CckA